MTRINEGRVHSHEHVHAHTHGPSSAQEQGGDSEGHAEHREHGRRHHRSYSHTHFRVYKRRWFGLVQLVLLNIVLSFNWLTFSPVSTTSAVYFGVSETAINWLSTGFMFAFVVMVPFVIWTLNRGPKEAILWSSVLMFVGSWIRYAGTRASGGTYGPLMFGQIVVGLAQPFALAAPTRYSDLWFTESGRVSATAVASLANPFGAALAQLVVPFWATKASEVPNMVLYVAVITTIATVPGFFIPAKPPTPPSASSHLPKINLQESVYKLANSSSFWLILAPFVIYVGSFNAFSSLINQILYPYGYSESEAGICGALLIVVGLVTAAITSPILDRSHAYLLGIKLLVPVIGISYLALVWAPQTRTLAAPYTIAALLGAGSFSLVPITLEYLVEVTFPASPEVGSTICWAGGQLVACIYIIVMNALKDGSVDLMEVSKEGRGTGTGDRPPGNMFKALVFQAVIGLAVLPLPLCMGVEWLGLGEGKVKGRLRLDEHRERDGGVAEGIAEENPNARRE
ncbi:MFS general substrate transporter [Lindgomyces ingoldianus]|uniref:MFS general substrate transporter n=1 Tax=Lindgomyces ingoldianus TaxID=673940 RepID=A0ACB6QHA2_9PLEO|nr:MFS general substrate transporter [Lindgomyces ingoldianus]KAF2465487.1 MFS general substrate transporter [Lindgomyces ingoldianus]